MNSSTGTQTNMSPITSTVMTTERVASDIKTSSNTPLRKALGDRIEIRYTSPAEQVEQIQARKYLVVHSEFKNAISSFFCSSVKFIWKRWL